MLIEASDPSIRDVMGLLQHLNMQELKDLLHDERRLETMIRDSQKVNNVKLVFLLHTYGYFLRSSSRRARKTFCLQAINHSQNTT